MINFMLNNNNIEYFEEISSKTGHNLMLPIKYIIGTQYNVLCNMHFEDPIGMSKDEKLLIDHLRMSDMKLGGYKSRKINNRPK